VRSIADMHRGCRTRVAWVMLTCIMAAAALSGATGCGQRYIQVDLERPGDLPRPVWVGVYFLSQESALDDVDTSRLADPDGVPLGDGVVKKEVYPLHPGGVVKRISLKGYDPLIRWVVVAAGFPEPRGCARQKVLVKEGAKLTIAATVGEECIRLQLK
jgi:predicted component of type VI protein secretion system